MSTTGCPASLLFLRHLETDLAGTFCGASDPPLNARGRTQCAPLLTRLQRFEIDAVFTSDLTRAQQTAQAIAEDRQAPLSHRLSLREIDFGEWEALTWAQIEARDPEHAARWLAEFPALPAPGGEPFATFRQRVLAEIAFLRSVPFPSVAVVTHAGVLRILLQELGGVSPELAWQSTRAYGCTILCTQTSATGALDIHREEAEDAVFTGKMLNVTKGVADVDCNQVRR